MQEIPPGSVDPLLLKLQHKLVVLGGGRQADARGGDVRRLLIHNIALSERSTSIGNVKTLYLRLAVEHPGLGGRVAKIQSIYRGFIVRRKRAKEAEVQNAAETQDDKEVKEDHDKKSDGEQAESAKIDIINAESK